MKTDQPSALLEAFPDGDLPRVTELIIELGRESAETIGQALARLPERIAVRLALPMITRSWDREDLTAQIRHFLDAGIRRWEAANLSALEFLPRDAGLELSADWPLYTLNALDVHPDGRFSGGAGSVLPGFGQDRHTPGRATRRLPLPFQDWTESQMPPPNSAEFRQTSIRSCQTPPETPSFRLSRNEVTP